MTDDPNELPALLEALGDAQPAYFTKPTPGAQHDLAQARIIGAALGTPPYPWQALMIRIASEKRADDPRRYRWPIVIITTPRQVGKTTGYRVYQTTKCVMYPGRQAFYTAQTGKDARARWKDIVTVLTADDSPFKRDVSIRLSAGDPQVKFSNGSTLGPFAPTAESLHGYTPDDVAVDEGFAFDDAQGSDLEGAIIPAQQRVPARQFLIFSTAGNKDSTWLRRKIEQGRQLVDDPGAAIAFLEWSMPVGADPADPASWVFHPGLGPDFTLADMAEQYEAMKDRPQEWLRAFMNTWSEEADIPPILTAEEVEAVQTPQTPPKGGLADVCLAYETAYDRSRAVIAAAWYDPQTGRPAIRIAERLDRARDLAPAVASQLPQHPRAWGADDGGPTRDVTDQLRADGHEPAVLSARDFATATDAFIARVKDKTISLDADPYLDQAIADAVLRDMGQGVVLDRRKSRGPIPEVIAAVVALRLLENAPAPAPAPMIWTPND